MPRARVPYASSLASAEFPVLPFLAPRVFAESPIARRNNRHHGNNSRTQKEEANTAGDNHDLKTVRAVPAIIGSLWGDATGAVSRRKDFDTAGGLLHTARLRWRATGSMPVLSSVDLRYADIYTFAHQYTRSYRTVGVIPRWVVTGGKPASQQAFNAAPVRKPSPLTRRGLLRSSNREKAMLVERQRLATLVAHELDPSMTQLLGQGQYRSLRRRITNLMHWDETQIDLYERTPLKWRFRLIRAFAALDRTMYPKIGQHTRKIIIRHEPRCARWSANLFPNTAKQDVQQTWENWVALDLRTRRRAYQHLLVYLLDRKPARALQFIHVLATDLQLHDRKPEIIADALGHLAKIHSKSIYDADQEWDVDKEAVKRDFVSGFVHIFCEALSGHRKVCSQDLLYNLANIADAKDLKITFDCLVKSRAFLGFDTILHYANTFAKGGDIPSALKCLHELKGMNNSVGWEAVSDRERLRWTCALLLRKSMSKNQEYTETPSIVAELVRLGIKMDVLLYNVVMHNAMDAGDYATAFKVYNALAGNELKADKHTYSILLHGCASQSDPALFSQFAQHCADRAEESRDPWLATDYLYYLYTCHRDSTDDMHSLALLQQAYLRFFTAGPLELIGSKLTSDRMRSALNGSPGTSSILTNATKLTPPPVALYIMLQAGIRSALGSRPQLMLELYQRFRFLVQEESDPSLTELAKRPTIWNAFLLAFCRKQQFASASRVIKDMTNGSPQPNIHSWNIFMQTFFKTDQVAAAERVFELLRSRGVQPDQYTYGVLLRGYAKAQHIERIGEIMQHVDAEQEMDPDLLNSLSRVVERKKLMLILEKRRIDRDMQSTDTAQLNSEKEKARWTAPTFSLSRPGADASSANKTTSKDNVDGESKGQPSKLDSQASDHLIVQSTPPPDLAKLKSDLKQDPMASGEIVLRQHSHTSKVISIKPGESESSLESEPAINRKSVPKRNPIHIQSMILRERTIKSKPAVKSGSSSKALSLPERPENLLDPDVQYRKLQEELGLVASSSVERNSPHATTIKSPGANLGFKSPATIEREQQSAVRVRRIAPGAGSK
jgi:pentatricopeptide repeat protein